MKKDIGSNSAANLYFKFFVREDIKVNYFNIMKTNYQKPIIFIICDKRAKLFELK